MILKTCCRVKSSPSIPGDLRGEWRPPSNPSSHCGRQRINTQIKSSEQDKETPTSWNHRSLLKTPPGSDGGTPGGPTPRGAPPGLTHPNMMLKVRTRSSRRAQQGLLPPDPTVTSACTLPSPSYPPPRPPSPLLSLPPPPKKHSRQLSSLTWKRKLLQEVSILKPGDWTRAEPGRVGPGEPAAAAGEGGGQRRRDGALPPPPPRRLEPRPVTELLSRQGDGTGRLGGRVSAAGCRAGGPAEDATKWSVAWLIERCVLEPTLAGGLRSSHKTTAGWHAETHTVCSKTTTERKKKKS